MPFVYPLATSHNSHHSLHPFLPILLYVCRVCPLLFSFYLAAASVDVSVFARAKPHPRTRTEAEGYRVMVSQSLVMGGALIEANYNESEQANE